MLAYFRTPIKPLIFKADQFCLLRVINFLPHFSSIIQFVFFPDDVAKLSKYSRLHIHGKTTETLDSPVKDIHKKNGFKWVKENLFFNCSFFD